MPGKFVRGVSNALSRMKRGRRLHQCWMVDPRIADDSVD